MKNYELRMKKERAEDFFQPTDFGIGGIQFNVDAVF